MRSLRWIGAAWIVPFGFLRDRFACNLESTDRAGSRGRLFGQRFGLPPQEPFVWIGFGLDRRSRIVAESDSLSFMGNDPRLPSRLESADL